jgi:hypothetical protein
VTDLVDRAARALRGAYDGTSPQAAATERRVHAEVQRRARRRRVLRAFLVPLAAAFVVSSAWAATTGHVAGLLRWLSGPPAARVRASGGAARTEDSANGAAAPRALAAAPSARASVATVDAITAPPPSAPAPSSAGATSKPSHAGTAPGHGPPRSSPPSATSDPEGDLYAIAHRAHFVARDPALALQGWDQYLSAYPEGRFAPEARYNRALALVRLGRLAEAREELTAFAEGRRSGYRQAEARSLLEALGDGGAPSP